ncbi:winged helix-turn-helix domain-containing protein [Halostagnicola sp. A-GB9-2]|uniref:winged helix-turn-helix domain-containing protein n=1 Tax=Halostagnicola sp. A-GB9-2 TaxID=3048066 RepID=UPI0024C0C3EE|nr:winged helix-turn-helix domain-containing protein [Halostagnicola sp. A-GB9-2]MDJ1432747.1 winged helix-turn-helix domain-containing protein [Halostagnicola sp. A-GB9-2]
MSESNRDDGEERPRSDELFAQLDDEYARRILVETTGGTRSAKELSDACNASLSTIYRRAERLIDCGLLAEQTIVEEEGNHYSVYEARLDSLTVDLDEDGFSVTIEEKPTDSLSDRLTDMWEGL